jgi:hypothetical protein
MLDREIEAQVSADTARRVANKAAVPSPNVRELLEALRPFVFAAEGKNANGGGKISCEVSASDVLKARRFFSQLDMQLEESRVRNVLYPQTLGEE